MMIRRETFAARSRRWRLTIGCLVLTVALSSCQIPPAPPLLSPIEATNGEYGYADLPLGENRYQVSYAGPSQRGLRSTEARQQVAAAERAQAFDFALWHASQITRAQGYTGFRVSNVRTNVDSMVEEDYDPFYAPDWHPANRFGGPLMGRYWGGYASPSPYIDTRTQIVIDIALLRSLETGDYDASETIDRLSKAYPDATGPVVAPAG
jgi:hypothetical protein